MRRAAWGAFVYVCLLSVSQLAATDPFQINRQIFSDPLDWRTHNRGVAHVFQNPAAALRTQQIRIKTDAMNYVMDYNQYNVNVAVPVGTYVLAGGWQYLGVNDIYHVSAQAQGARPVIFGQFPHAINHYAALVAMPLDENFDFGLRGRYLTEDLYTAHADSWGVDVGLRWSVVSTLWVGGYLPQVAGADKSWSTGHVTELPKKATFEAGYEGFDWAVKMDTDMENFRVIGGFDFSKALAISVEHLWIGNESARWGVGLELTVGGSTLYYQMQQLQMESLNTNLQVFGLLTGI